jgi:hypothetical protein
MTRRERRFADGSTGLHDAAPRTLQSRQPPTAFVNVARLQRALAEPDPLALDDEADAEAA